MLLVADGRLDNELVEGVWDEGDQDIDLGGLLVESLAVVDIEGDGVAVGQAFAQLLGAFESTAGDGDGDACFAEDACSRPVSIRQSLLK